MKQTIFEHERSPFNKRLLASKRTPEGHMVLSERNITIKHDGTAENSRIDRSEFEEKFTAHFI